MEEGRLLLHWIYNMELVTVELLQLFDEKKNNYLNLKEKNELYRYVNNTNICFHFN